MRDWRPSAFVVVGGHHATVCPQDFDIPAVDAVVIGEGVVALREILHRRAQGACLGDIRGLGLPATDGMIFTEPRPYTPLDDLPLPDRSLTAPYRARYFSEWFKPLASIRTSLGCAARCNFCALWSITGGKYLRRDADAVVAELATVAEKNVFFCDDESMWDTRRMDLLADKIRAAGIRKQYFLYARVDTIVKHPDLFAKWARLGLAQVFVGMEDFSNERLAAMNKGVTTDQQEQAARILERLGVMTYASFMVDPDYSREDFHALVAYIRKLRLRHATFTIMTPLPGTQLHRDRAADIVTTRPEMYDMLHALLPTRLGLEQFYEEYARLYTSAVPLHRALPVLFRFGLHGMLLRLGMFSTFLRKVRASHLDHHEATTLPHAAASPGVGE